MLEARMARLWLGVVFAVALGAGGVAWWVARPPAPQGYSGIRFARVTAAAAARAPLLATRGALIEDVAEESPAARAGIKPGAVVSRIDGIVITSARQASDLVRSHGASDQVRFTLFDEGRSAVKPRTVTVTFDKAPPVSKTVFSVDPPRLLAREKFALSPMAANASWSRRLKHGVSIRLRAMPELQAGVCSGLAPEKWRVENFGPAMIHLVSSDGELHAVYKLVPLDPVSRRDPKADVLGLIHAIFRSPVTPAPEERQAFGISSFSFGNRNGLAGFALWRTNGPVMSVWIAGVPAGDASWAVPLAASTVLSLRCDSKLAPVARPRDTALADTAVSTRCLDGQCEDSDFAATYLSKFRLGYVHAHDGTVFLVNPRRDLWLNGQEGPGFYRQLGGENEMLEPGRTN
jgi:hypothetical protein